MKDEAFQTSRSDGRSDAEVIVDLVKDGEPGQIYKYDDIIAALQVNTSKVYDIAKARQATYSAHDRLLKKHAIALENVANVGYRLAPAGAHQAIAQRRKHRSDVQMQRGLKTLQNVRWGEMDPEVRKAHEGALLLMAGLVANQRALEARQSNVEEILKRILNIDVRNGRSA